MRRTDIRTPERVLARWRGRGPGSRLRPVFLHRMPAPPEISPGRVWSAGALLDAPPTEVLAALTDPAFIARWSPVDFELERLDGRRLRAGTRARISGSVAGLRAAFDVDVLRADAAGLELRARGPLDLDVAYRLADSAEGTAVLASIALPRRGGLTAQLLRAAATALLDDGALDRALGGLAQVVSPPGQINPLARRNCAATVLGA